ncbi:hypothetical protein D3C76_1000450 [compost metagenome]
MLLDVAQLAGAEPLAERLGTVADVPGAHQEFGEMRACRGIVAVAQLLLHRPRAGEGAGHALGFQAPADLLGARPAAVMQVVEGAHQRLGPVVEGVTEHMDGGAAPGAGQLHAVDQLHAQFFGGGARLGEAFEGVVVGQGEQAHPALVGAGDDGGGRKNAVGGGAVAMQIDTHGLSG